VCRVIYTVVYAECCKLAHYAGCRYVQWRGAMRCCYSQRRSIKLKSFYHKPTCFPLSDSIVCSLQNFTKSRQSYFPFNSGVICFAFPRISIQHSVFMQYITGENLKVVWTKFSTLSQLVLLHSKKMYEMRHCPFLSLNTAIFYRKNVKFYMNN
jgi:hypothetical protein